MANAVDLDMEVPCGRDGDNNLVEAIGWDDGGGGKEDANPSTEVVTPDNVDAFGEDGELGFVEAVNEAAVQSTSSGRGDDPDDPDGRNETRTSGVVDDDEGEDRNQHRHPDAVPSDDAQSETSDENDSDEDMITDYIPLQDEDEADDDDDFDIPLPDGTDDVDPSPIDHDHDDIYGSGNMPQSSGDLRLVHHTLEVVEATNVDVILPELEIPDPEQPPVVVVVQQPAEDTHVVVSATEKDNSDNGGDAVAATAAHLVVSSDSGDGVADVAVDAVLVPAEIVTSPVEPVATANVDDQDDSAAWLIDSSDVSSLVLHKQMLQQNLQLMSNIREEIEKIREADGKEMQAMESRRLHLSLLSSSCPSLNDIEGGAWDDESSAPSSTPGDGLDRSVAESDDTTSPSSGSMNGRANADMRSGSPGRSSGASAGCGPPPPRGHSPVSPQSSVKIYINDVTVSCSQDHLDAVVVAGAAALGATGGVVDVGGPGGGVVRYHDEFEPYDEPDMEEGAVGGLAADGSLWRRRSWLGLDQDDGGGGSQKAKIKRNLARTQRSMSLSSLDSDEDAFYDAHESLSHTTATSAMAIVELLDTVDAANTNNGGGNNGSSRTRRDKSRSFSGGSTSSCAQHSIEDSVSAHSRSSTYLHSDDEVDGRDAQTLRKSPKSAEDRYLLLPRTPLQKSISTPSILAVKDTAEATIPSGKGKVHTSPLTLDGEDDPALSKRKKRGSIFFRKKKVKDKEKENKKSNSHQFVTVCYSNSTLCDVCAKPMANKPALRCENCMVNVHEHSCKDQISDCSRFRGPVKMNARPISLQATMPTQLQVPRDRPVLTNLKPPSSAGPSSSPSPPGKENRKQNGGTPPKQTPTSSPNIPGLSSPSKVISEEREADGNEGDIINKFGSIIDINSASMESLDEGAAEMTCIEDDPELRFTEEEPEQWSTTVDKKILKKLKDKDIKRQENIYEFIITEKHHCLTLKIMQKLFAQGMLKELHMTPDMVDRIFPRLEDILDVHMTFLKRLRERQKQEPVIGTIADLLLKQFQGESAQQMKAAYGEFCSRHKEAVSLYKDIYKSDRKFQNFIKKCGMRPICKARGVPECILLVTQRITKYPLLIESLIKASKDNKVDQQNLIFANGLVKDILCNVNAQVAEKEREQRLLEIYNRIDAKSATLYKQKKFKKSDLLSSNRKLKHEGTICLKQTRGKEIEVTAVVLSDVIFFLQESNQKYNFVTQDNKAGVISLQKLLVREKAGQDNRGLYLISSNPSDPEMYEMICQSPKDKKNWMEAIRQSVDMCPEEDEGIPSETEEERKVSEAKSAKLRELTATLHEKDRELAVICEEKMRILGEMMEVVGKEECLEPVQYLQLVDGEGPDTREMLLAAVHEASRLASSLYVTGTNLSRSVSSAGEHQSEAYVSPILPKRAETFGGFDNPNKDLLPKPVIIKKKLSGVLREPDTWVSSFGNLLHKNDQHTSSASDLDVKESEALLSVKEKPTLRRSTLSAAFLPLPLRGEDYQQQGSSVSMDGDRDSSREMLNLPTPPMVTLGREQWSTTIQLSHYLNTLMCVFSQHFTNVEILKTELAKAYEQISKLTKESGRDSKDRKNLYRPNQQLEELRNLQEQLTKERTEWQKERELQERQIEEKRQELLRLQESTKTEQEDVHQQRDLLYRQLEALQKRGIMLSPASLAVVTTSAEGPSQSSSANSTTGQMTAGDKTLGHYAYSPSSSSSSSLQPNNNNSNGEHVTGVSPNSHRRSMSCDLPTASIANSSLIGAANAASSHHHYPPPESANNTTTTTTGKPPKGELKPRASSSNLTNLMKRDLMHLPINLHSAYNQQKTNHQGVLTVKQQLPLKLAALGAATGGAAAAAAMMGAASGGAPPPPSASLKPGGGNRLEGASSLVGHHSFSGATANPSGLSHVLNTSPYLKGGQTYNGNNNNGGTGGSMSGTGVVRANSSGHQPQSYLHGHAAQWNYGGGNVVSGATSVAPSASDPVLLASTASPFDASPPVVASSMTSVPSSASSSSKHPGSSDGNATASNNNSSSSTSSLSSATSKIKDRFRRSRDPETNQKIIYF